MTIKTLSQPAGSILEIAYVVNDLELAVNRWVETVHAGPFFLIEHLEIIDPQYRGNPTDIDVSIALGFSGSVCVELIFQHDNSPSVFRELATRNGEGFHHWGVTTEDLDAEIGHYQQSGYPLIFSGAVAVGGRFAFLDTAKKMNGMVELIELTPAVKDLFGAMEAAAKDWDGKDPIRRP